MQEIKKKRILLASVLKPVNDPRMFEKIGQSLSPHYDVHIIGTKAKTDSSHDNIIFHPLASYTRLGLDRILSPLRILKKILYLRPALLVICTHELLWVVLIAKIFLRCPVVYDIQENYFRNILYTNSFPPILRVIIALYVRIKEWLTIPAINSYFLAEAGYEKELTFVRRKKIILENKVKKILLPPARKWSEDDQKIHLLFTGTLAPTTGIFVAIDLATKLHASDPNILLHVVGFSPMVTVHQQIKDCIRDKPFILFSESREPISHVDILKAIQRADFGIIAYPPNASTRNTIPTKLFEYLGYALPIVLIDHPAWVERCEPYPAAIPFQLNNIDAGAILHSMKRGAFYSNVPKDVFWESEEDRLLQTVQRLLTIYFK